MRFEPPDPDALAAVMASDGPLIQTREAHCSCDFYYYPHDDPGCPLYVDPLETWRGVLSRIWWDVGQLVRHRRMAVEQRRRRRGLR